MRRRNTLGVAAVAAFACWMGALPAAQAVPATPVVPPNAAPARIVNADNVKLPGRDWGYAYGPTIVRTATGGRSTYHTFVCSTGRTGGTIDQIRYTSSTDGRHWSAPKVVVSASGPKGTLDYSACDPSVVQYHGWWYLFYSGARDFGGYGCVRRNPKTHKLEHILLYQTVVRVARARSIEGPWQVAVTAGAGVAWADARPADPPKNPAVIVGPKHVVCNRYGAGQQSVLVKDDRIVMFYTDDTAAPGGGPSPQRRAAEYMMTSTDPVRWDFYGSHRTDDDQTVAGDFKYDDRTGRFVELAVPSARNGISEIVGRWSTDGLHWRDGKGNPQATRILVGRGNVPRWSRPEGGLSGGPDGHLLAGNTLLGYACPHDHCTSASYGGKGPAKRPTNGYWDLWGYYAADLSRALFG